jgi:hypothetical protein
LEQIENLLEMKDESSQNLKLNGLKFINSLCKDKLFYNNFIDLKGENLLEKIIDNYLRITDQGCPFRVFKCLNLDSSSSDDIVPDPIISEALSIYKKLNKNGFQVKSPKEFCSKIVCLLKQYFPSQKLYEKGKKILQQFKCDEINDDDDCLHDKSKILF